MSLQGAIAAIIIVFALHGCEFIPGTAQYQMSKARHAVAEGLIDPSSAQFRNLQSGDNAICGEVNGKNRMGAYVGFVRFYVETSNWNAVLDPQFDPQNLASARTLCSLSSYSASACIQLAEEEAKQALQAAFDSFWVGHCTGPRAPPVRVPFDPTQSGGSFDNESEALSNGVTNAQDANMEADSEVWFAPPDDSPLVDADGNPIDADSNASGHSTPSSRPDAINQNWLDRAISRPSNRENSNQVRPQE